MIINVSSKIFPRFLLMLETAEWTTEFETY